MRTVLNRAAMLVASRLFAVGAVAKDEPPAADPKAVEVIRELGLAEAPVALRDSKAGAAEEDRASPPHGSDCATRSRLRHPGVEFVVVKSAEEMAAQAAARRRDHRRRQRGLRRSRAGRGEESALGGRLFRRVSRSASARSRSSARASSSPTCARWRVRSWPSTRIALMFALVAQPPGFGRPPGDGRRLEPQLRGLAAAVSDRQDDAGGGPRRHRPRSRQARARARHEGHRHARQLARRPGLRELRRAFRRAADADRRRPTWSWRRLPLVPATTNLFDAKMFARMKKTAFFINVGRGGSVVTDDLVTALNNGVIAGAGLDVTEPEPLPKDHPLWKAKNIIITPHMSAQSDLGQGKRELDSPRAVAPLRRRRQAAVGGRFQEGLLGASYLPPAYIFVSR